MDSQNHHDFDAQSGPVEVLPLNRVKRLMKEEADVKAVSAEASYAAARATEFLIEALAARAFQLTHTNNRDIISYGDVATTVSSWDATRFLKDIVPHKLPLSEIIKRVRSAEQVAHAAAGAPALEDTDANAHEDNGRGAAPEENGAQGFKAQQYSQPAAARSGLPSHDYQ